MCLVALALDAHPRYALIIAGNRDELHARPTEAAHWWGDAPGVFGGRDLVAGGSWLAVDRRGRVALVTNYPARLPGPGMSRSRGALVREWSAGDRDPQGFIDDISAAESAFPGFCVVVGTAGGRFEALISPPGPVYGRWTLPRGITVLGNTAPERPTPKVHFLERELGMLLAGDDVGVDDLFARLGRREPVESPSSGEPPGREPSPDALRAQARLTPFVLGPTYGTRSSTVIRIDRAGRCEFVERRFAADGQWLGETAERFVLAPAV